MMSVDAAARTRLASRLDELLGAEEARTLMTMIGPDRLQDLATRDDLRGEVAILRGETAALGDELREEMATLGADLRREMASLGADLRGEMEVQHRALAHELTAAFRGELNDAVLRQGRATAISLAVSVATIGGVSLAVGL